MSTRLSSFVLCAAFAATCGLSAFAEESGPADAGEPVPYGPVLLGGFFAPGIGQIALGEELEGRIFLATSLPLLAGGAGLLVWDALDPASGVLEPSDAPFAVNGREPGTLVRQFAGAALLSAGLAIDFYAAYAFHRDWSNAYRADSGGGARDTLPGLLASPFVPEHLLAFETLAPLAALGAVTLASERMDAIRDFFEAERQPFMGYYMPPAAALCSRIATAGVLSLAEAIATETLFRGLVRERDGEAMGVCLDVARGLPDAILPGLDVDRFVSDLASSAIWGIYATVNVRRGGGLGGAVSARFWFSLAQATLGYLADPWNAKLASVSVTLSW